MIIIKVLNIGHQNCLVFVLYRESALHIFSVQNKMSFIEIYPLFLRPLSRVFCILYLSFRSLCILMLHLCYEGYAFIKCVKIIELI